MGKQSVGFRGTALSHHPRRNSDYDKQEPEVGQREDPTAPSIDAISGCILSVAVEPATRRLTTTLEQTTKKLMFRKPFVRVT